MAMDKAKQARAKAAPKVKASKVTKTTKAVAESEKSGGSRALSPFEEMDVLGAHGGFLADPAKRRSITGPCKVRFAEAYGPLIDRYHADEPGKT